MLRIDRRAFNKLSVLALAGSRIPAFAQATTTAAQSPVGYAAIGLGAISDIFMRACANSKTAKITALVTGHPETKGKKYAAMYGIPETSIYTSNFGGGGEGIIVSAADVDQDGKPDVLVVDYFAGTFTLVLNNASSISAGTQYTFTIAPDRRRRPKRRRHARRRARE